MKRKCQAFLRRFIALTLFVVLLTIDASAVMKEVDVWGARSINDEGMSDNRITMEELQDDYKDFVQTNGLREYFHKDKEDPSKVDLSEALSWLIDKEIINRDETITVSNVVANKVPQVSITKMDVSDMGAKYVMRSDAIMYLYKAVYGPIDARTIGVETDNVRVDDGVVKPLYQMMLDHDYFSTATRAPDSIVQSESTGGDQQVTQSCVTTPTSHIDRQTVTTQGGNAGQQQLGWAGNINSSSAWRYTPQGDLYDSMFGDTNIFISDVDIAQQGNTGNASQSLGIATNNDENGDVKIENKTTQEGDVYSGGGPTQAGNHNAEQHEWGGTGGLNQGIAIETDYKQIYYAPGADIMFYRTSDVVEQYIRAALSKGLLQEDVTQRTDKFRELSVDKKDPNQLPSWSPYAPAYIVNRQVNKLQTAVNVETPQKPEEVLGVNFDVRWKGNTLTITRKNLFMGAPGGNTGAFFITERIYKMDVYKYIYAFIQSGEKKLSKLEADIVNYKYGMELDGVAKTEEETEIIKYLIAKGILSFDDTNDFVNLYSPINYDTFCTLLYRVANKDARLDFSLVQLTDSETSWKAKGFAPQTLYVTTEPTNGIVQFKPDERFVVEKDEEANEETTGDVPLARSARSVSFNSSGAMEFSEVSAGDLLNLVATEDVDSDGKQQHVILGANTIGSATAEVYLNTVQLPGGFFCNLMGAAVAPVGGEWSPEEALERYIKDCIGMTDEQQEMEMSVYDENNPMLRASAYFCNNLWVIATLRNGGYASCLAVCDKIKEEWEEDMKQTDANGVALNKRPMKALSKIRNEIESTAGGGTKGLDSISFKFQDASGNITTASSLSAAQGSGVERVRYVGQYLYGVSYTYKDSTGNHVPYTATFPVMNAPPEGSSVEEVIQSVNKNRTCGELKMEITSDGMDDAQIADKMPIIEKQSGEVISAVTGSAANQAAQANGSKLLQYRDGKDGFLAWSQITSYNANCANKEDQIPLQRISDLILFNQQTNTYAYFSVNEGDKRALVGTSVVNGDSTLGVAFKDGDGASAEYYYHINVIRLLIDAKQETNAFSGLRAFTLDEEKISNAVTTMQLHTSSGHSESALSAVKALISKDDKVDSLGANGGQASKGIRTPYNQLLPEGNTRWGRFITLSQANRAANIIYAKKSYTKPVPGTEGAERFAYAVVIFNPTDLDKTGTPQVSSTMSMQDLLDAAAKPPSNEAGLALYDENKAQCNAMANWVYGTSGIEYIRTGYLQPEAYLYYTDDDGTDGMPASIFDNTGKYSNIIKPKQMKMFDGAMCPPNTKAITGDDSNGVIEDKYRLSYYLSADYRAIVAGERLYLNEYCFSDLHYDSETFTYSMVNTTARRAQFTLGGTFELHGTRNASEEWIKNLRATVLETKSDGTIRCQVGPIPGMPVKNGTSLMVFDADRHVPEEGDDKSASTYDWKDKELNRIAKVKTYLGQYGNDNLLAPIVAEPHILLTDKTVLVNVGDVVKIYANADSATNKTKGTIPIFNISGNSSWTMSEIRKRMATSLSRQPTNGIKSVNDTVTYVELKFNADTYTVKDGELITSPASAADFLSPSLFTNLNDMIIDEMMNVDNGAIPINDIPSGCLLRVGTGYYCATGADPATKTFVGYAHLDASTGVYKPQKQDAAKSFANHFIRGGNDYINVSHYFKEFHLIPDANFESELNGPSSAQQTSLNTVASSTLNDDADNMKAKVVVYPNGDLAPMGKAVEGASKVYTPCSIQFDNSLLAYPSQIFKLNGGEVQAYTICSAAKNAAAGDFANLPFFTDSILEASLTEITGTTVSTSYVPFSGDLNLMAALRREFQQAFAGDLYTLARLILFVILVWLFVASWLCYGFFYGNLMPIIDAIKYPTRDRGVKGVDLFKLISFGTISVDTDFKLGRFIKYDLIIAVLMLVVWKSGNITF